VAASQERLSSMELVNTSIQTLFNHIYTTMHFIKFSLKQPRNAQVAGSSEECEVFALATGPKAQPAVV
jgi:hypothetical protein